MRRFGYPIAFLGTLLVWIAFLEAAGWHGLSAPLRYVAFGFSLAGFVLVLWSGFLVNRPLIRGFVVSALCLLVDAGLIWFTVPVWVNAGSGQDAVTLVALMGAGTSLFFGLALLIGAVMAAAFSSEK